MYGQTIINSDMISSSIIREMQKMTVKFYVRHTHVRIAIRKSKYRGDLELGAGFFNNMSIFLILLLSNWKIAFKLGL